MGWEGLIVERSEIAANVLNKKFSNEISNRKLIIINEDFLHYDFNDKNQFKFDLIISSMVLEHLDDSDETYFFKKSKKILNENGKIIGLVPAGMRYWGVKDIIAGHYRRYERFYLKELFKKNSLEIIFLEGLTFPISNILLPLSNF